MTHQIKIRFPIGIPQARDDTSWVANAQLTDKEQPVINLSPIFYKNLRAAERRIFERKLANTLSHEELHFATYKTGGHEASSALDNQELFGWYEVHGPSGIRIMRRLRR